MNFFFFFFVFVFVFFMFCLINIYWLIGTATVDGGIKGGYLIRSFTKAMADPRVSKRPLKDIMAIVSGIMYKLIGSHEYQSQTPEIQKTLIGTVHFKRNRC